MILHADETRTKIVCTIGPASRDPDILRQLIRQGMDVARVNFSHGSHDEHRETIARIRQAASEERATIAVLADLQGPKLRVGMLASPLDLAAGDRLSLVDTTGFGHGTMVPLPHPELIASASPGDRLLFDDGEIGAVVREVAEHRLEIEVVDGGRLSSHKGVSAPGGTGSVQALTEKDRVDARFATEQRVDFVALSFVRDASDLQMLRSVLAETTDGERIAVIAKIEKPEAIQHLDEILSVSDAVMVARGDLGVELSPQEVPLHQKEIIRKCNQRGVPVITATQMLQSMIDHPRPTRAEASDVANAILDGTDAVMLSGETAIGAYPVHAVAMMREISQIAESQMPCRVGYPDGPPPGRIHPITDAICEAAARMADELDVRLIATSTSSGYTARQIARQRPRQPVIAMTPDELVSRQLALVWGVVPVVIPSYEATDDMLAIVTQTLLNAGYAHSGDQVVLSAGLPPGVPGKTNFVKVHRID